MLPSILTVSHLPCHLGSPIQLVPESIRIVAFLTLEGPHYMLPTLANNGIGLLLTRGATHYECFLRFTYTAILLKNLSADLAAVLLAKYVYHCRKV